MRSLYEKSGSANKFADFAIDIRKAVAANALPEYALEIAKSRVGEEGRLYGASNYLTANRPSRHQLRLDCAME